MIDPLEKAEADWLAQLEYAREEGRKIGIGKCVRALISLGLSDIEIVNEMEISEELLKEIKSEYLETAEANGLAQLEYAKDEDIKEGIKIERIKTIKMMIEKDMPLEQIAALHSMTTDEILEYLDQNIDYD